MGGRGRDCGDDAGAEVARVTDLIVGVLDADHEVEIDLVVVTREQQILAGGGPSGSRRQTNRCLDGPKGRAAAVAKAQRARQFAAARDL
jgi:hypothetical protein